MLLVLNQTANLLNIMSANNSGHTGINIRLKEIKGGTLKNNINNKSCKISAMHASLYAYGISNKYNAVANQIVTVYNDLSICFHS